MLSSLPTVEAPDMLLPERLPSLPGGVVTRISSSVHWIRKSERLVQMRVARECKELKRTAVGGVFQNGSLPKAVRRAGTMGEKSGGLCCCCCMFSDSEWSVSEGLEEGR
jgi:hypothetical protein